MSYKRESVQKSFRQTQNQALIAEQERLLGKSLLILVGYFIVILLLSYWVPEDVLVRYPGLGAIIEVAESWIPSVENFGEVSAFSQVAQLVFMLEILTLPLLLLMLINKIVLTWRLSVFQWVGMLLVIYMLVYGYFIYIPGDGRGHIFAYRILHSMANSKIFFAIWTSLYTYLLAWLIAWAWALFLGKNKLQYK